MLTRLQVQGFKNLLDIDLHFGSFTCITGPNAVGKSNLFDAIRFLHLLTQHPIMEAVKLLRETKGRSPEPRSLFTSSGNFVAPEIRFIADLLIHQEVEDDLGVSARAAISTLRYTLALRLSAESRLELAEESLVPVNLEMARRDLGFPASKPFKDSAIRGRRVGAFISTSAGSGGPQIKVHQEGHGGRTVPAPKSARTVVGALASSDFPTVLAVHREMQSWSTLLLEPSAMRAPAFYADPRFIDTQGANLPAAIERLRKHEAIPGQVNASLANKLAELIDDVTELRVRDEEKTESLTLEVRGRDGVFHAAGSLSDGTLRFLVLSTLAIDPASRGVICLEEPENGIHPDRIGAMVRLLKDIAVDAKYSIDEENPLRQVIVNTHSPKVVSSVEPADVVSLEEEQQNRAGVMVRAASPRFMKGTWREKTPGRAQPLAAGRMASYLESEKGQLWLDFLKIGP